MSWDVAIVKFSEDYASIDELPEEDASVPLGTVAEVHAAVTQFFPGTDWSNPARGTFDSPLGSIEFTLGDDDPASEMLLHVRASDEVVVPIIEMCNDRGWNAVDCSTGEFLESSQAPTAGIEGWRALRDKELSDEEE